MSIGLAQSEDDGIRIFKEANTLQEKAQTNTDLQQAVKKYQQALSIFEVVKFKQGIGATANNLGNVFAKWGQYDRAVDYYEKSLAIKRELKGRMCFCGRFFRGIP
jgi:tetratricopeptide (TPR) repeat protein